MNVVPTTMSAVLLTGHGGLDKLVYRDDVAVPKPRAREVLVRVAAAGLNNTDINTRIGWYSSAVRDATSSGAASGFAGVGRDDGGWTGQQLTFPRIQGVDCCGRIAAVGEGVDPVRIGERVVVNNLLRSYVDHRPFECWTFGSECDGGFAQFARAPAAETFKVDCDWSDAELAALPCNYATAENMLTRAGLREGESVLVTGASGGVGSAAVQLAKRRGAKVVAITAAEKAQAVYALGADEVIARGKAAGISIDPNSFDVVADVVGGADVRALLACLRRGGRYAVAGAIAGPLVEVDLRAIYLRDISLFGCTFQDDVVFGNIIKYAERNEIRPVIGRTYPLEDLAAAERDFLEKKIVGKLVLIPPPIGD